MENLTSANSEYEAGVCNIGPIEIAKRKKYLNFSLIGAIVFVAILFLLDVSRLWWLLSFFPFVAIIINYLQVRNRFCVACGLLSVANFGDFTPRQRIKNSEHHRKDLHKVRIMFFQAITISFALTLLVYWLS
ncbi:MAG: hypothetical protein ACXAC2_22215 [Candidatus Kariarchaeaceae archaeon]|jgi:hypothetical protein